MLQQICIIGTGLIGASFGMALRRARPDIEIRGYDERAVVESAMSRGAITRVTRSLEEAVTGADVVIVAVPMSAVEDVFSGIASYLVPGVIVTDVCSVKCTIKDSAARLLPDNVVFVGGHPMAGSEKTGPEHADELMFENATYALCPPDHSTYDSFESDFAPFIALLQSTGARIMLLTAEQHDRIAAVVSHVPQLLAISLVNLANDAAKKDEEILSLAAGGFRDMTRIASSPYQMWEPILIANQVEILDALEAYGELIGALIVGLRDPSSQGPSQYLAGSFESAEITRASIPDRNKGFLRPLADVFVFLTDEAGAVHKMTGVLSRNKINLKDIELLKIREGTGGTFRIGLETAADAKRALVVFRQAGMKAHMLS